MNLLLSITSYIAERCPLDKLSFESLVRHKSVPIHSMSWAYYMGGLSMFFMSIQVLTGLLLLFYYQPTVVSANLSIKYLMDYVAYGALIRNMHTWSSSCMIFFVTVHLITTFAMKSFERPREFSWTSGVILLFLTLTLGFTGYLLPWNQIAVNATKVGLQSVDTLGNYLPGALSKIPHILRETFQGEAMIGQSTLTRFFALHVVILPLTMALVLGLHLLLVQLHGMSQGTDKASDKSELFVPVFFVKDLAIWSVAFLLLFVLALCLPFESFMPFPLLEPYNPLGATPPGIKPEWYFYFLYYPLELLPFWLVMLGTVVGAAALLAVPWLFRKTPRRTLQAIALTASTYLIIITLFGQRIYEFLKK